MEGGVDACGLDFPDVAHRVAVPTDARRRSEPSADAKLVSHLQRGQLLPRHSLHRHRSRSARTHGIVRSGKRTSGGHDVPCASASARVRKRAGTIGASHCDLTAVDDKRVWSQNAQGRRGDALRTKRHRSTTKVRALNIFRKPTLMPIAHARAFAGMRAIFPGGNGCPSEFSARAINQPPTRISRGATLRVGPDVEEVLRTALIDFIRNRFVSPTIHAREIARRTPKPGWATDDVRASLAIDAWARTGRVCAVRPAFKPTMHNLICSADVYRAMPLIVPHIPACARDRLYAFMLGMVSIRPKKT